MSKSTAVAERKNTALSTDVVDFSEDAGLGFEEADSDAFAIPFIRILQSGSPQCKKSDGAYIEGAEEGVIFDTSTSELMGQQLNVIPCHYRRVFIEWVPQDEGGGFVAEHDVIKGKQLEAQLDEDRMLPNGHQLVDTRMHYCINAETGDPLVICMASTQLKKSRNWMNIMDKAKGEREDGSFYRLPMFAQIFSLTTIPEKNDKGSWFGWKIERTGLVEDHKLYQHAKNFRNLIVEGKVEVKYEQEEVTEEKNF